MSKVPLNSARVSLARFSCIYVLSNLLFCLALLLTFVTTPEAAQTPAAPTQLSIGSGTAPGTGGIIATDSAQNATPSSMTSGLVAHWKFDEGTGTNTTDSSGNNNHGTLVNGPTWTTGIAGSALYFDGVNDSVTVPDSPSLRLSSSFTLSAWVNPASVSRDWRVILAKNDAYYIFSTVPGSSCGGNTSEGHPFGGFSSPDINFVCQSLALPINTWTHLALTYNGSTLTLYRNGLEAARTNISAAISPRTQTLQIGGSKYGEHFNGIIDEVRIYNRALSGTEIQGIYQQNIPATPQNPDLVAHWKFDEGTGTNTTDSSGNSNHGTLVNGPTWTTGIAGGALYFDGVNDSVTVPDSPSLRLSSSFTLSAWVNPASVTRDWRVILAKNDAYYLFSTVPGSSCGGNASEGYPFGGFSSPDINFVCKSLALPINTWTHLTLTYNGSTLTLYRNGLEAARTNISAAISPRTQTLQIGGSKYGEHFNGIIDEVRIYNRALSGTEIQGIYQQDAPAPSQTVLPPVESFTFSLSNAGDRSVNAGSSVTNTVTANLLSGSTQGISLSVSGLPSGANASFSHTACNPTCSSILSISTTAGTSPGTFPITITAAGGGMSKTTTFMLTVFLTATSTVSSVSPATGPASLYVAKHGNDAHTCSQAANPATPKLTIGAALDCFGSDVGAAANKVIEVAAGTYAENLDRFWNWPKGSSWSAPFTLRAKLGDTVTIQPKSGDKIAYFHDGDNNIPFYVIIKDLRFDGRNQTGSPIIIGSFAPFIRYDGIRVTNVRGMGILGGGNGTEVINSHFDAGPFGLHKDFDHQGGEYAYPFYVGGSNLLFDGNIIEDFPTFGIHMYRFAGCPSGAIIRNNIVRNFGWGAFCGTRNQDPRCNGRGSDDKGTGILTCGTNHQVYNNLIYNGNDAINLYTGGNNRAYNNTIYNMTHRGIVSNNPNGNVIRNNIVYNPTAPRDGNIFSWQNPDTSTYSNNLCGQSGGGCSLGVNPLFVDPTNGNFNLQSGSPAAGIGSSLY